MFQLVRARPRLFLVLGMVLALVLVSSTTVLAAAWATSAGKVQKLKVVSSDVQALTTATSWSDVPSMSLTLNVPKGQAIFLITFSAVTGCGNTQGGGLCWVRLQANGQTLHPGELFFSAIAEGDDDLGAHSMQFFTDPLPAGTYEFKAQWKANLSTTSFGIVQRTMSVLRAKV